LFGGGAGRMGLADDLYRAACDDVARVPTPGLDAETRKIWVLIGTIRDATWRRTAEPGFSLFRTLVRNAHEFVPEYAEEVALWDELTAPHNYAALVRYVENRRDTVNEAAERLHTALLVAARRRNGEGRSTAETTAAPARGDVGAT
jgi:hypothetical protein